jgi:small subunit ribosomal protein S2
LGGTLSNFQTIKASIDRMRKMEDLLAKAEEADSKIKLHKRERVQIAKELFKLNESLGGIRNMKKVPEVLFVIDINKEFNAIAEARRLRIPVIALVDSNVDPTLVDFPIPSNDDAARTIGLFVAAVADAIVAGRAEFEARRPKEKENGSEMASAKGNSAAAASQSAASV